MTESVVGTGIRAGGPAAPSAAALKNFVGGRWVESRTGAHLDVHNPARGEVIARTPLSTAEDVGRRRRGGAEGLPRLARHAARRTRARDVPLQGTCSRSTSRSSRAS